MKLPAIWVFFICKTKRRKYGNRKSNYRPTACKPDDYY